MKDTGKRQAQKYAFALANNLIPKLKQQGITEQDLWEAVRSEFCVDSRSEISELGWVLLTARFHAATHHQHLFDVLCQKIITCEAPLKESSCQAKLTKSR